MDEFPLSFFFHTPLIYPNFHVPNVKLYVLNLSGYVLYGFGYVLYSFEDVK